MSKAKKTVSTTDEGKQVSEQPKLLIRAPEAAVMLTLSERKLWELTNRQLIPHVRIGKKAVRYCPEHLRAWIDEQTIGLAC